MASKHNSPIMQDKTDVTPKTADNKIVTQPEVNIPVANTVQTAESPAPTKAKLRVTNEQVKTIVSENRLALMTFFDTTNRILDKIDETLKTLSSEMKEPEKSGTRPAESREEQIVVPRERPLAEKPEPPVVTIGDKLLIRRVVDHQPMQGQTRDEGRDSRKTDLSRIVINPVIPKTGRNTEFGEQVKEVLDSAKKTTSAPSRDAGMDAWRMRSELRDRYNTARVDSQEGVSDIIDSGNKATAARMPEKPVENTDPSTEKPVQEQISTKQETRQDTSAGRNSQSSNPQVSVESIIERVRMLSQEPGQPVPVYKSADLPNALMNQVQKELGKFETGTTPNTVWARFELKSEAYGRLETFLEKAGDVLRLVVRTENSQTAELVQEQLSGLKEHMENLGFRDVDLQFTTSEHQEREQRGGKASRGGHGRIADQETATTGEPIAGQSTKNLGYNTIEFVA